MNIYFPRDHRCGFYIYAYINAATGIPYYIGKGSNNRAWDSNHSVPLPCNRSLIVIMESGLTDIGAWALERKYIRLWGRINNGAGCLLNVMPGGPEVEQTPEMIAKQLATKEKNGFKSMSSAETIERWKESRKKNNKKRSPEMNEKILTTKLEKYGTLSIRYGDTAEKMLLTKKINGNFYNANTPESIAKRLATKQKNGTMNSSTPETVARRKETLLAKWGTVNTREIGKIKKILKSNGSS